MATATSSLPLSAGTWTPDLAHSSVEFVVRHMGLSKVRGRFGSFDAQLVVGNSLHETAVSAAVALESVDTGNPDRDTHLKTPDFFGVESHPTMEFRSTRIVPDGGHYRMAGDLMIKGVTNPVELDAEFTGVVVGPDGELRAGFSAVGELSRKSFGIEFNAPLGADAVLVADRVRIELEIQFVAPAV
ncbi:MAG: YceI family protein [Microthrixaceae bacterium]